MDWSEWKKEFKKINQIHKLLGKKNTIEDVSIKDLSKEDHLILLLLI